MRGRRRRSRSPTSEPPIGSTRRRRSIASRPTAMPERRKRPRRPRCRYGTRRGREGGAPERGSTRGRAAFACQTVDRRAGRMGDVLEIVRRDRAEVQRPVLRRLVRDAADRLVLGVHLVPGEPARRRGAAVVLVERSFAEQHDERRRRRARTRGGRDRDSTRPPPGSANRSSRPPSSSHIARVQEEAVALAHRSEDPAPRRSRERAHAEQPVAVGLPSPSRASSSSSTLWSYPTSAARMCVTDPRCQRRGRDHRSVGEPRREPRRRPGVRATRAGRRRSSVRRGRPRASASPRFAALYGRGRRVVECAPPEAAGKRGEHASSSGAGEPLSTTMTS